MSKFFNAATGQWEDDGQPDPSAMVAQSAPTASNTPVIPLFPPKPEREVTVTREQRIASPDSVSAATRMAVASGAQLNANEQEAAAAAEQARVEAQAAADKEAELKRLKTEQQALDDAIERQAKDAAAADAAEAAEVAKKQIAAGRAKADFWKGNAGGEIFAALLRGADRAVSTMLGQTGPTGVDRIIDAKIADHERALVAEWEASKEARELKAKSRTEYAARLAQKRLNATNQSAVELQVIGARLEKGLAALGPDRAAAVRAQKDAAEQKAAALLEQKRAEGYDELRRIVDVQRSSDAPGRGKALSAETRDLLIGAEQYGQLAQRNMQIIAENGGQIPVKGPLATEFQTNDTKMASVLQKPLGKSDEDAKTARRLQGSPTITGLVGGKMGVTDPVGNYRRALEVNTRTLVEEANKAAALEQPAVPRTTAAPPAAPPAPAPIKLYRDPKTGEQFKGRLRPDGKVERVE